jgi:hypothetical protein
MITWRIWRAVHTPFVAHPIYWRRGSWLAQADHSSLVQRLERQAQWLGAGVLGAGLLLTIIGRFELFLLMVVGVPVMTVVVGIPAGVLLSGIWYGFICATTSAVTIRRERYQGRLALLGATPYGLAGAAWALGSISIQRSPTLLSLRKLLAPTYFMIFLVMLLVLPFIGVRAINYPLDVQAQRDLRDWATVMLIVLLGMADLVQSASIGALVGMIVPVAASQLDNAFIGAVLLYLAVQIAAATFAGIVWLVVWPVLGVAGGLGWYVCGVLTLIVLREMATLLLWFWLIRALDADFGELDAIVHLSLWRDRA